ncbi:hybrid sensor histidine kinase/response regulator transcription factor [Flammeovirga pacifica]|uniref:histidine kinase n=1 Tax=Flammeovirga pacifica TaxID=915059 RepID=A0A1S1YU78_FLAPC|nr:hybrid sensor histidine kinase/response regulator transcription factor [Flammeovirga pacifica]OHX64568.1 hypothetical protein NH26_23640 [Flammeovirga pacifica]
MNRKIFFKLFTLVIFLNVYFISTLLASNNDPFLFKRISNKEGLNQNSIYSLVQDDLGFIWMGTPNGLIKYDGNVFTTYQHQLGNKKTLLDNFIKVLYKDKKGNIWIGTSKGICVYLIDEDKFIPIQSFNKLVQNSVLIHTIAENNGVWLATSLGLFHLKEEVGNYQYSVQNLEGHNKIRPNQHFSDVIVLEDHTLLASSRNSIFHLKIEENSKVSVIHSIGNIEKKNLNIRDLYQDAKGVIWVGGLNFLECLSIQKTSNKYSYQWKEGPQLQLLSGSLKKLSIMHIFGDDNGENIWIGTNRKGLFTWSKSKKELKNYTPEPNNLRSLSSYYVNDFILDKTGVLWIATAQGGINKVDLYRKPFYSLTANDFNKKGLSGNLINDIFIDSKQRIWIGTFQNGMNVSERAFNLSDIEKTNFRHLLGKQRVFCFLEINQQLLIGTNKGFQLYDIKNDKLVNLTDDHPLSRERFTEGVLNLLHYKNQIWVGTHKGLRRISFTTTSHDLIKGNLHLEKIENISKSSIQLSNSAINTMMYEESRGLWIGIDKGLFLLESDGEAYKVSNYSFNENEQNSLSNNRVFSIFKDKSNGNIWVGTYGGGLNKMLFDSEQNIIGFDRITEEDGLFNNVVYAILKDTKENLWLSTDAGICKFNPEKKEFKKYNMGDGLSANNFRKNASFQTKNGIILLGGLNGLTAFSPNKIIKNPYPSYPIITDFKIFNESIKPQKSYYNQVILEKSISHTKKLVLPHDLNQLTFDFSAMHYATPEKNTFGYKLEGIDKEWTYVDNQHRSVNYTQLPFGKYTLNLKGFNGDGVGSQSVRKLEIEILRPFYKTYYAYLFYFLVVCLLIYLVFKYLKFIVRLRNKIEIEKREKNHAKEINEAKLKFFTDISHEFRTPLTLMVSPLEKIIYDDRLHSELKPILSNINTNGQRLISLTNSLIDFRKLGQGQVNLSVSNDNLGRFIEKTSKAFVDYAKEKNVKLNIHIPKEEVIGWFDSAVIERILFNLLSNAFKFTPDRGNISVYLTKIKENEICLEIQDTGKGMSQKELKQIFKRFFQGKGQQKTVFGSSGIGLFLVNELVNLHKGEIKVFSEEGKGTSFKIYLPINKEIYNDSEIVNQAKSNGFIDQSIVKELEPKSLVEAKDKNVGKILVVEDNIEIQALIESIFKQKFDVYIASDGQEGFQKALEIIPDLMIVDVMMPIMNGYELSNQIKNDRRTSHIPLLFLTALNDFDNRKTAFEEGGDVHISKPFSPYLLELQVNNLLETKRKEAEYIRKVLLMEPDKPKLESKEETFLHFVKETLEKNYINDAFNVKEIAEKMAMSYVQFYRKFKALTGCNPNEYLREFRLKKAAEFLKSDKELSVNKVMYDVGFNSQSYFTKAFKKQYGITPAEFKKDENITT